MKLTKRKIAFCLSGAFLLCFLILILLLTFLDVRPIGPDLGAVGLAGANGWFATKIGHRETWERLTEVLGYLLLLEAAFFAGVGFFQWIRRKRLSAVDREMFFLAGLYVLTLLSYLFFDRILVINCRPVLLDGELPQASFPSSHVLLSVCVPCSAIAMLPRLFADKPRLVLGGRIVSVLLAVITVAGRFLSGVHWFTDILGGLLLGGGLTALFYALIMQEKTDAHTA